MLVVLVHNLSYISIHAPARGATAARSCPAAVVLFQSTPPRGGRQNHCKGRRAPRHISIHAPARGATLGQQTADKVSLFQSTPPRGGRLYRPVQYPPCVYDFNPRPREGGDDILAPATESELHFNPRPREGGDGVVEHRFNLHNISIHAPARGATAKMHSFTCGSLTNK